MGQFEIIAAVAISFAVTAVAGKIFIPILRRLKYGQTINDVGPTWHKNKEGTPTMGGIIFIIGICLSVAICLPILYSRKILDGGIKILPEGFKVYGGIILAVLLSLVGFADDFIKIKKKRNLGLTAVQKTLMQLLPTAGYILFCEYLSPTLSFFVPILGNVRLGVFYIPYLIALIVFTYFMINAVNLTDGIDGLCSSTTLVYALAVFFLSGLMQTPVTAVISSALIGGMFGFLLYNFYPAKLFMGDTGSMFLGAMVVILPLMLDIPILILLFGIIYFIEAGSVVLQVLSVKIRKKRIFKMSPIHHHFEMSGWSEKKIVGIFTIITALVSALAILSVLPALLAYTI